jgi:quercetin dioxygenase-like cupin family protein
MTIESAPRSRDPAIQTFLDTLLVYLAETTRGSAADAAFVAILGQRLSGPAPASPAMSAARAEILGEIDAAMDALAVAPAPIRKVAGAFAAIAPIVPWYKRAHDGPDADHFAAGHGNALVVGPGGAEDRANVLVGVSLMAPQIRYPDHRHPPDELYLVLSDGEWRQGEAGWFRPVIGGTVRNPPGILHAMRSGATPLLAVWAQLV